MKTHRLPKNLVIICHINPARINILNLCICVLITGTFFSTYCNSVPIQPNTLDIFRYVFIPYILYIICKEYKHSFYFMIYQTLNVYITILYAPLHLPDLRNKTLLIQSKAPCTPSNNLIFFRWRYHTQQTQPQDREQFMEGNTILYAYNRNINVNEQNSYHIKCLEVLN